MAHGFQLSQNLSQPFKAVFILRCCSYLQCILRSLCISMVPGGTELVFPCIQAIGGRRSSVHLTEVQPSVRKSHACPELGFGPESRWLYIPWGPYIQYKKNRQARRSSILPSLVYLQIMYVVQGMSGAKGRSSRYLDVGNAWIHSMHVKKICHQSLRFKES